MRAVLAAALASVVLVGGYLLLGGGDYEPSKPPDPCRVSARSAAPGLTGTLERVGMNALAGAACDLHVSRERLVLALAGERPLGIDEQRRTEAFRKGLREAIDEEERTGRIGATEAFLLRQAVAALPVDALLDRIFGKGGL